MSLKQLPEIKADRRLNKAGFDLRPDAVDRWEPAVCAAAGDAANSISIYDSIGENWEGTGVTAKRISAALRSIGDKDVVVNVNSPGGDFFEGVAIYNLLREHAGKVTVRVLGVAASAASVIAMAGDEILMGDGSFLMIHNAWAVAVGNPIREFDVPFGASGANISYALPMQRHMAEFGSTPEQFASIASWARHNAQSNPDAIFYGQPATVEEVLASPVIASPLHLFEIVMPVAGGCAVVVVSPERARTLRQPPVHLLGAGEKVTHRAISQAPTLTSGPLKPAMAQALKQAGVGVEQMSLLSLYDCYTIMVALTIEDAGLCAPGQFGHWLKDHSLGFDGSKPINTHGGQLGFGQPDLAGGMTHVVEAVRQLRHKAGQRQIRGADLALVTGNGATVSEAVALVLGAD